MRHPIIIFGTGRSGTTVFHQLLSTHPHVAWLSRLCNVFPHRPEWNRLLMHVIRMPMVGAFFRARFPPGECYPFWEHYCKGFRAPFRDLVPTDVTERNKKVIRQTMSKLTTQTRPRLLIKVTGWPRLGFLGAVFEDARFIHVLRDGRAVANSLLTTDFWRGWQGPQHWEWGPLPASYANAWNQSGQSFVALAGLQWNLLMDATERAKQYIPESRLLEIRYEDICADPVGTCRKVTGFLDLDWTRGFENGLRKFELKNANAKWQHELTERQQRLLEAVLQSHLQRYGYMAS